MPARTTPSLGRLVAALGIGTVLAVSCAPPQRWAGDYSRYPLVDPNLDPQVAQVLMQEWTVTSSDVFQRGMALLQARTTDPTLNENLERFSMAFTQGIRRAGWRLEPVGGAYDAWLYLQQVDGFLGGKEAGEAFGPRLADVRAEVAKVQELLDTVLGQMLIDIEAAYDQAIAGWVDEHPLEGLELARVSPAVELAVATDQVRDAWQAVARAEFTSTAAYARLNDALLSLPEDLRHQIQVAIRDLVREPLVVNALVGLARLGDGMKETAAAISAIDGHLDDHRDVILGDVDRQRRELIEVLQAERSVILETLAAERATVLEALAAERQAVLDAVAAERAVVLEAVVDQRIAVVEAVDVEGDKIVGTFRTSLVDAIAETRVAGEEMVGRAGDRIGRIVLQAAVVLAGGVVLAFVAMALLVRRGTGAR